MTEKKIELNQPGVKEKTSKAGTELDSKCKLTEFSLED